MVYARSGQVVILGGLMQNRSMDTNSGTPLLGNLPVLGHLFSQQRNSSTKSELVILLRPMIMGPDGLMEGTAKAEQRFREFREVLDRSYKAPATKIPATKASGTQAQADIKTISRQP